jgi:hypothetical protein
MPNALEIMEKEIKLVISSSRDLENHLQLLKMAINEAEENNTQIESANPFVSLIDTALEALSMLRSDLEEITDEDGYDAHTAIRKGGYPD